MIHKTWFGPPETGWVVHACTEVTVAGGGLLAGGFSCGCAGDAGGDFVTFNVSFTFDINKIKSICPSLFLKLNVYLKFRLSFSLKRILCM